MPFYLALEPLQFLVKTDGEDEILTLNQQDLDYAIFVEVVLL